MKIQRRLGTLLLILVPAIAVAHHGTAISFDSRTWTTWATVTEFNYKNPHPSIMFDRTLKDGKVEHWVAELASAPAPLARAGWTKSASEKALKPGTRVKLYISTSLVGGMTGIVRKLENEKGENIVTMNLEDRAVPTGVDMDGVPLGLQPIGSDKP